MIKIITKFGKLIWKRESILSNIDNSTGKSFSETLILASVNPWEIVHWIPPKNTSLEHVVYKIFCFCFDIQNNICTQLVINLYFSWNSMNNLSSYCGLTDSRMRASDTDLPVQVLWKGQTLQNNFTCIFSLKNMSSNLAIQNFLENVPLNSYDVDWNLKVP